LTITIWNQSLQFTITRLSIITRAQCQQCGGAGTDFYQIVVPRRLVASATSGCDSLSILFTDDSKGGAGTGFGVFHSDGPESSFPSGVGNFYGIDSYKGSPSR
jgi:hypothetical protein